MKKLKHIFSFLNKKGVFALGLVFGIVFSLFFSNFVFASNDSNLFCVGFFHGMTLDYNYYANYDFSFENTAGYKCNDGGAVLTNVENAVIRVIDSNGGCNDFSQNHADVYSLNTEVDIDYGEIYVYMFSSRTECLSYLNGEIDASSALNYEEIKLSSASYDKEISSFDYAYFQKMTNDQVVLNFGFNNDDYNVDGYKIVVSSILQHKDTIIDIVLGHVKQGAVTDAYMNSDGLYKIDELTLASDWSGVPGSSNWLLLNDNSFNKYINSVPLRDNVLDITCVIDDADFYLYAYQVELIPYSNGSYGDSIIILGYPDDLQAGGVGYGISGYNPGTQEVSTKTQDDNGNSIIKNEYNTDSSGNISIPELDTSNVLDYISNGYGLLGNDGYLELLNRTFIGVPAYIWAIIATALTVSIIVIIFKIVRGM